jgi:hypothetical protein
MRVWNISDKDISQLYNSKNYCIKANSIVELSDDLATFLLSKKQIRGLGLVQLKDGDSKEERYKQGRLQIFEWATEKYNDFLKHCEEREAQRLQPLAPHKEIKEYKAILDAYQVWEDEGMKVSKELQEVVGEKIVFMCPICSKTFPERVSYFGHMKSHDKEKKDVNPSSTGNESSPKS